MHSRSRSVSPAVVMVLAVAGLLLAGATTPLGCATRTAVAPPPEPDILEREDYVIGHGDLLRVTVWKQEELSVAAVPVRPDGKISVPLVDDVQAAGLTSEELKELLTTALSEYVVNPDVTVVVLEVRSKRVNVLGEVIRSGAVGLAQDMRVMDAITAAGGFGPFADRGDIKIIRRTSGGGEVMYRVDYDDYIAGKEPASNLLLKHGDTIVVPD